MKKRQKGSLNKCDDYVEMTLWIRAMIYVSIELWSLWVLKTTHFNSCSLIRL